MFVWSKNVTSGAREGWEERFQSIENSGLVITERPNKASVRVEIYCGSEAEAEKIREQFGGMVGRLVDRDWVAMSAPEIKPVRIRDRFVVTPERDTEKLGALAAASPGRDLISIPAEMAFGTGDHATTATCLRLLCDLAAQGELPPGFSCLDLGCGTGILTIAAKKLGAGTVQGIDYDPAAVEISKKNAVANGVERSGASFDRIDVLSWEPDKSYDVIVANLFSDMLVAVFPKVKKCLEPGGHLIVSGILDEHADECLDAGGEAGFRFRERRRRGRWVTALAGHASRSPARPAGRAP